LANISQILLFNIVLVMFYEFIKTFNIDAFIPKTKQKSDQTKISYVLPVETDSLWRSKKIKENSLKFVKQYLFVICKSDVDILNNTVKSCRQYCFCFKILTWFYWIKRQWQNVQQ